MQQQDSSDPTGVRNDGPPDTAVTRSRERKANAAIQLKVAGADWDEIATVLGFPTPRQAKIAVELALEREGQSPESKRHLRQLSARRLERLLRGLWAKAIDPNHPEHLAAVDRARLLIERHAKLFGLDAPAEFVVTSPSQSELEAWVTSVVQTKHPTLDEADIFDIEVIDGAAGEATEDSADDGTEDTEEETLALPTR